MTQAEITQLHDPIDRIEARSGKLSFTIEKVIELCSMQHADPCHCAQCTLKQQILKTIEENLK